MAPSSDEMRLRRIGCIGLNEAVGRRIILSPSFEEGEEVEPALPQSSDASESRIYSSHTPSPLTLQSWWSSFGRVRVHRS